MTVVPRAYWEADRSTELADYTVGGLLADRARTHPDRLALIGVRHGTTEEVRLSYAQLYDEACRVAAALSGLTERRASLRSGHRMSSSGRSCSTAPHWREWFWWRSIRRCVKRSWSTR
jgi:hypothetical protein